MTRASDQPHLSRPGLATPRAAVLAAVLLGACAERSPWLPDVLRGASPAASPVAEAVGLAYNLAWGRSADAARRREVELDQIGALGVSRVRCDLAWHRLEPEAERWQFEGLDALVDDAAAAGIRLLGMLGYSNPAYVEGPPGGIDLPLDARPENFVPPAAAPFAAYVARVVAHYGGRIDEYEIWNEPNIGFRFWRPAANAGGYARLARAAIDAGRAACADCRFAVGSASMPQPIPTDLLATIYPDGPTFLRQIQRVDPTLYALADAVSFHPYQYPKDPPEVETRAFEERPQGSLATQIEAVREIVAGGADPAALWITENGWPTNPGIPSGDAQIAEVFGVSETILTAGRALLSAEQFATLLETVRGVSEQDQARFLVRSILIALSRGVARIFLYTLQDQGEQPEINQEAAFGLYREDGTPKPAAQALRALIAHLGGFRFAQDVTARLGLDAAAGDRALAFTDGRRVRVALWNPGPDRAVAIEDLPAGAQLLDEQGEAVATVAAPGRLELSLGAAVRYLEAP